MIYIINLTVLFIFALITCSCSTFNICNYPKDAVDPLSSLGGRVDAFTHVDNQRITSNIVVKQRLSTDVVFMENESPNIKSFSSRYVARVGVDVAINIGDKKYLIRELSTVDSNKLGKVDYYAVSTSDDHKTYYPISIKTIIVRIRTSGANANIDELELKNDLLSFGFVSDVKTLGMPYYYIIHLSVSNGRELAEVIKKLLNKESVGQVEFDYIVFPNIKPNDPYLPLQWALDHQADFDINAPTAWNRVQNCDSKSVGAIAVIDSGIDVLHPDLAQNIWVNPNEVKNGVDDDGNGYIDDINGYDFVANSGEMIDPLGHGTHVAGIIGAQGNDGIGITGLCWKAKMMSLRFINARNEGKTSDAILAINYAVRMGAKIINNSWGGGPYSDALKAAIINAYNNNVLFVAAAGNDGRNTDVSPYYPQGYNVGNVISVANIRSDGTLNNTSNFGSNSVDIAAPGTSILSTYKYKKYAYLTGTSMAAPYVSAHAAQLMTEIYFHKIDDLVDAILGSTKNIPNLNGKIKTAGTLDASYNLTSFSPIVGTPPIGSIVAYAGSVSTPVAAGFLVAENVKNDGTWLVCSGRQPRLRRSEYPELFAAIGHAWTQKSEIASYPEYFRIPALDGYFLRTVDHIGFDRLSVDRIPIGDKEKWQVGSYQNCDIQKHSHHIRVQGGNVRIGSPTNRIQAGAEGTDGWGTHTTVDSDESRTNGRETRPVNVYVNYIIRVK